MPRHLELETFFDGDPRLPSELSLGALDGATGPVNITLLRWLALDRDWETSELLDDANDSRQRDRATSGDVEDGFTCLFRRGGQEVRLDDIADESEVTNHLAVELAHW